MEVNLLPFSNGERRCSEEGKELQECLNECHSALILSLCGCLPQTLPMTLLESDLHHMEYCTFEQYNKCLNYTGNEESGCKSKCFPNCTHFIYTFQADEYSTQTSDMIIFSVQYMSSSDYTIFTEFPSWSFNEFIGALGGALGFWLGIDIIVIVLLILKPFVLLMEKILAKCFNQQLRSELQSENGTNRDRKVTSSNICMKAKLCNLEHSNTVSWYIEKLIWAAIYIAGGGYTISSAIELIQQYNSNENIYTRVKLMMNKSITIPPATMNIGIDRILPEFLYLSSSDPEIMKTFYSKYLTEYFNDNATEKIFLQEEITWPIEIFFMVYQYLSIVEVEACENAFYDKELCSIEDVINWQFSKGILSDSKFVYACVFHSLTEVFKRRAILSSATLISISLATFQTS